MAIADRGSTVTANSAGATSAAPTFTAGIVANDVGFMVVSWNGTPGTVTPPAGWSQLYLTSATVANPKVGLYWRRAAGSLSGSETWSWVNSVAHSYGQSWFSGCDTSATPTVTSFEDSVNNASLAIPTQTVAAGALLFTCGGANSATVTFTAPTSPTGFSELWDAGANKAGTADRNIWATGGATGTVTITASAGRACSAAMATIPEASAAAAAKPKQLNYQAAVNRSYTW